MRHYFQTCDAPDLPSSAFTRHAVYRRPATLEGGGGKGGGGSPPAYPDPQSIANATTSTNEASAAYNKALNLNNYSNPFGSQQTQQIGTDPSTGAPIYNTSVSANPQLQAMLSGAMGQAGQSGAINQNALNSYGNISAGLGGLGSQAAGLFNSLNPQAAQQAQQQGQQAAYASQTQYLDPQFAQQGESMSAQLANQGLTPGSEAYNNAQTNFNNQKQQAYSNAANQSILTGSQIGTQNYQNQLAGLSAQSGLLNQQAGLYGQQAGLAGNEVGIGQLPYSNLQSLAGLIPGYSGTATSQTSPADISGLYNNQYQSQLAGYNAGQSSSNSMMSGLFGLGSSAIGAYMSDRRMKRDIRRVGTWANGLAVYTYRYVGESARHIGFMADEVRKVAPTAVLRFADGFDRVLYRLAIE
ncbi:MAG TPA: tail fiber domain-containing protein [Steroidobacteraceae bacterium]|nr:tail fiber domain-containing protein [Steroidobacteraceae bacterium]